MSSIFVHLMLGEIYSGYCPHPKIERYIEYVSATYTNTKYIVHGVYYNDLEINRAIKERIERLEKKPLQIGDIYSVIVPSEIIEEKIVISIEPYKQVIKL